MGFIGMIGFEHVLPRVREKGNQISVRIIQLQALSAPLFELSQVFL